MVSINKVKEVIEKSSWYEMDPHDSWYLRAKSWLSSNLRGKKYVVEGVGSGVILDTGRLYFDQLSCHRRNRPSSCQTFKWAGVFCKNTWTRFLIPIWLF